MVKHGEGDGARKRAITIRHCGCIRALHANIRVCRAQSQRTRQFSVHFDAVETLVPLSQPVRSQTWARPHFQNIIAQIDPTQRPGQDFIFKFLLPLA